MVLFLSSYLLWGMRTGTCHGFVYLLLLRHLIVHTHTFTDHLTTHSYNTLVAGLVLQSTHVGWWCFIELQPYGSWCLQQITPFIFRNNSICWCSRDIIIAYLIEFKSQLQLADHSIYIQEQFNLRDIVSAYLREFQFVGTLTNIWVIGEGPSNLVVPRNGFHFWAGT